MTAPAARRTHIMTDSERSKMVKAWGEGVPAEMLAKRYGVHPAYVRKAAARAGVRKREVQP